MKSSIISNPNNLLYSTFTKTLKSGYVLVYVNVNDRNTELFSSMCDGNILKMFFHREDLDITFRCKNVRICEFYMLLAYFSHLTYKKKYEQNRLF